MHNPLSLGSIYFVAMEITNAYTVFYIHNPHYFRTQRKQEQFHTSKQDDFGTEYNDLFLRYRRYFLACHEKI
jgi:hypothetical protein